MTEESHAYADGTDDAETMQLNDNCGRAITMVPDAETLEDGIIELKDEQTGDRYYVKRPD